MKKPDEIGDLQKKLFELDRLEQIKRLENEIRKKEVDNEQVELKIRIVRFKNLSAWLKIVVLFGWVIGTFFAIYFVTTFITNWYV